MKIWRKDRRRAGNFLSSVPSVLKYLLSVRSCAAGNIKSDVRTQGVSLCINDTESMISEYRGLLLPTACNMERSESNNHSPFNYEYSNTMTRREEVVPLLEE